MLGLIGSASGAGDTLSPAFAFAKKVSNMKHNGIHPLRRWRFEHGITLVRLSKKARTSAPHLSEIESGKKRPGPALAERLTRLTSLTLSELGR